MVGVGAVIFHDLFNQRIKNVDFSWKDVLSFDGSRAHMHSTRMPGQKVFCARQTGWMQP